MDKKFFCWTFYRIWWFISTPTSNWRSLRWISIKHLQIIVSLGKSQFWLIFMTHYYISFFKKRILTDKNHAFQFQIDRNERRLGILITHWTMVQFRSYFRLEIPLISWLQYCECKSWWSCDNPRAIWIWWILFRKIWWHNLIGLIFWCLVFRQFYFSSTNCLVFQMKSSVLMSWKRSE